MSYLSHKTLPIQRKVIYQRGVAFREAEQTLITFLDTHYPQDPLVTKQVKSGDLCKFYSVTFDGLDSDSRGYTIDMVKVYFKDGKIEGRLSDGSWVELLFKNSPS